jgi:hypothetical protein
MRRLTAVLLTALALGALCACGAGGDEGEVKDIVHDLYAAFAAQDAVRACRLLAVRERATLARRAPPRVRGGGCERVLARSLAGPRGRFASASDVSVEDVKVDGDSARAAVSLHDVRWHVGLVRQGGVWRIDDLNLTGVRD